MKIDECSREQEMIGACLSGFDAEMESHLVACPACRDTVLLVRAFSEDRDASLQDARVPPAGLVWWRAQLRARQSASRAAERPLALTHAFAGAAVVGVAVALISLMSPWLEDWMALFQDPPRLGFLLGVVIALAVVAPLALYFVVSDK